MRRAQGLKIGTCFKLLYGCLKKKTTSNENKNESQNSEKKLRTLTENCTMEEMEDDEV